MSIPEPDSDSVVPGMHIWGWMSEADLTWLAERAATMRSVAEIGCLHGRSSFALLTACPGPVYCIDPWNDAADESYPSFMRSCGHFPNLNAVRGYSPSVLYYTDEIPSTVDMTFIDGEHDYDSVAADVTHWLPRTTRLICGHDYAHDGYPDVTRFVDEFFADAVRVVPDSGIWYVEL